MKSKANLGLVIASWLSIVFIGVVSTISIYWSLASYDVVTIEEPIKILNKDKKVPAGKPILQELKINKTNDTPPTDVSRTILCGDNQLFTIIANVRINLPVGKYTLINDNYVLPVDVPVGSKCIFIWRQGYKVNPVKTIPVEWKSETFEVISAN